MATFSRQYYPNPDEDFVLRGGSPYFYRELPGFTSNSMLTTTSKNLSQHTYNADRYGDDPQLQGSLRTISRSLKRVQGDITRSLIEDDNNLRSSYHVPQYRHSEINECLRESMNKRSPRPDFLSHADWYTKPIHLTSEVNIPMSTTDVLAEKFFPITLGQVKSLEMLEDVRPCRGRKRSKSPNGKRQRSKSAGATRGDVTWDNTRRVSNQLYLTAEAPYIKTANISFTSPYSEELSKLRLEKLRIEEQQYLELKRLAELEKIRGPKPKWYELKNPEFHHEAHKNNTLLRNSDKWDDLLRYRESLINATTRLHNALEKYEVPSY